MKKGRLLLPWGLLAGLLLWTAAIDGLGIKPVSVLKKPRNLTTNQTTTTTTIEPTELTSEGEEEEEVAATAPDTESNATVSNSLLTGDPQHDYKYDPNLPRELPHGYNLSAYPFFSRVPNNVTFECEDDMLDGYYANVFYKCQVYHHCLSGIRYDFLCANYTAFDQKTFICHFVSEVDCANSAKFWSRNKGLYETPTTTTVRPLTLAPPPPPPPSQRRPAAAAGGGAGRRRRPYRRRRPQYDYYYDDEYDDDEYEDDLNAPSQNAGRNNRNRGSQQRPNPVTPSALDATPSPPAAADDKPFKADSSIYDRPRQVPKIRRPVPVNEREKYDYPRKEGAGGSEKKNKDDSADRDYDRPAPSRPRQKARPAQDDDEYYDDEDYELPRSSATRGKNNNQDYYAPTAPDRDFGRRPAPSGAGRPLRRNRQGARRRPSDEYDYDDRRPAAALDVEPRRRPSDPEARRRPAAYDDDEPPRRRPAVSEDSRRRQEDEPRRRPNDESRRRPDDEPRRRPDDEPRRRPEDDSRRRPEDEPRRRPEDDSRRKANTEDEPRRRPAESDEEPRRKQKEEDDPRRRPETSEEEPRRRPVTSEEEPRRRPAVEDESRRRPSVDTESKRRPTSEIEPRRRPTSSEEDSRLLPTSSEEVPRRRGTTTEIPSRRPYESVEEDARRKPALIARPRSQQSDGLERDSVVTRTPASRGSVKQQNSRDYSYDILYNDRPSSSKDVVPTGRDSSNDRQSTAGSSIRQGSRDNRDSNGKTSTTQKYVVDERPAKESTERSQQHSEKSRQERPSSSGSDNTRTVSAPSGSGSLNVRPLQLRNPPARTAEIESDLPIPAAKPAYISMLGREAYRKKVQDEETRLSATAPGNTRITSKPVEVVKTTEAPKPLYDDEYYYDDDEEIEDELPIKPTEPTTIGSRSSLETVTKESQSVRRPLTIPSSAGTVSVVTLGPGDVRIRGQSSEISRRIGPITESQARAALSNSEGRTNTKPVEQISSERANPEERTQARPTEKAASKKSPSSIYHFNEDGVLLETSTRAGFRPRSTTTQATVVDTPQIQDYKADQKASPVTEESAEDVNQRPVQQNSFRRKSNQASNIDTTKVLPTKTELKDLSGEVSIPPSGTGNDNMKQKVVTEVYRSTEAPIRLETEIFERPKLKFESFPLTGPSGRGNINYRKNVNDEPHRPILPDITDPEYDVTLNEAVVHPTRNPFTAEGATRIKVKVPIYHYRDAPVDFPAKLQGTLQSSASQTHISKAPYPIHEKYADSPKEEEEYENTTGEDEYDDIPTGKGATKVRFDDAPIPTSKGGPLKYEWTTYPTEQLRDHGTSIVTSRGTTGHQYVSSNTPQYFHSQQEHQLQEQQQQTQSQAHQQPQYQHQLAQTKQQQQPQQQQPQQQQSGTRLPVREFTQQPFLSTVRNNNQQYYKPQPVSVDGYKAQTVGVVGYRGAVTNPLLFSQSYDYDLAPKYRPTRKYAPFFGKPY